MDEGLQVRGFMIRASDLHVGGVNPL